MKSTKIIAIMIILLIVVVLILGVLLIYMLNNSGSINLGENNVSNNDINTINTTTNNVNSIGNTDGSSLTNTSNSINTNSINQDTGITNGNLTEANNNLNQSTTNTVIDDDFETDETGSAQYTPDSLNNFPFEWQGMTDEIAKYIKDMEELNTNIKKYFYDNGIIDATVVEVQKYEYQDATKRLGMIVKLNTPKGEKLRIIINENGTIDISELE